jgi:hypothetical protein
MIRIHPALLFFGLFVTAHTALWPHECRAADPKQQLQKIESELDRHKREQDALGAAAEQTSQSLKALQQRLITATENMNTKEEESDQLQDRLDSLNTEIATKSLQMGGEKHSLIMLTGTLVALSRQPPESLLLQSGLTRDTIHRTILIRAVLPRIRERADNLGHDLSALNDLKTKANDQKNLVEAAAHNLEEQQSSLDQMIRTRQGLLQRTEKQKEAVAAQLVSLASEAKDLRELLTRVTPRHGNNFVAKPDMSPALKWPVAGRILRPYGERDTDGVTSDGITFAALSAAPVVAPRAGKVVFAGPFKGYGKIIILQHDSGYHSFLAGFGRIDAEMGQDVEVGEPLGVMPVDRNSHPPLYFEWRHNSEPVNPGGYKP